MRTAALVIALFFFAEVGAQFGGLFDYGALDYFLGPGFNEGPCIERQRRRRRRRRKKSKTAAPAKINVINTAPGNNAPSAPSAANPSPQAAPPPDPLGMNFMYDLFNPFGGPPSPPAETQIQKPKGLTIDYSKLTNQELESLLRIAARQAGITLNTAVKSTGTNQPSNKSKAPSYSNLIRQLADLQLLAQEQKNVDPNANQQPNLSPAAKNFRKLGRNRRAARQAVSKRQTGSPFDLFGLGDMNLMNPAGGGLGFCACYQKSEIEPDYIIQSRKKWKCKGGLVCACNPGRFNKKKK